MRGIVLRIMTLRTCISHMGQQVKGAAKLGKFTKTDTLTEEFHSPKCLHMCIVICVIMVHCLAKCMIREKTADADCQHRRKSPTVL
ncbi:hypothetical protein TNIN_315641 [Trichonephila inaurata madagascariensis]|uniref:Uncharacterized protein n=1 Tax=Trichonephila inaurata madagascariensis TaxID=2747483 RepID=A0A8X7CN33_9ARAC|nr:hypothetical protein TNIN_315641 [Trichonephila inaurata madagascariensis]